VSPELFAAASSSTLAVASTLHATLLVLRQQRSVQSLSASTVLLPSLAFTGSPWLLAAPIWLAGGFLVHLAWFVACEKLLPAPVAAKRPGAAARPAVASPAAAAPAPQAAPAAAGPPSFQPVPVLAVFEETEDIKTFRMLRPDDFDFAAGQFLTVRVQVDGKPLVRCYSLSSSPEATGYMEISVKRQGVVSGMLHSTVRPGSTMTVKRPNGKFTYPEGDDRPIVFLAGGVGITPLMSMFRHAVASQPTRPVTLIFSAKTDKHITFRHELDHIVQRHPQAKVAIVTSGGPFALVTGGSQPGIAHFSGRINADLIGKLVPDIASTIFMTCGPGPMMEGMKELLASLGVPKDQIRYEAFEAAIATSKEETVPGVRPARKAAAPLPMPAAAGNGAQLTLQQSGITVAVGGGQSLLEAAEAGGVELPSSCRAGVCLTCRTRLLQGEVDCDSDSLDADDRAAGYILPCIAYAKGHCVLDA